MNQHSATKASAQPEAQTFQFISKRLRLERPTLNVAIKKTYVRGGESPWHVVQVGEAWLPSSPVNKFPIRLRERPELCFTIAAVLDKYVLRQLKNKSTHQVVSDIAKYLVKATEYAWISGFYRLQDLPVEAWKDLREKLVRGGFVAALNIEQRTVDLLKIARAENYLNVRGAGEQDKEANVRTAFLDGLGTNVSARELNWVRPLLVQARENMDLARSGDLNRYTRRPAQPMSVTMLLQCLRAFNLLSEIESPYGTACMPTEDAYAFANKRGRKGGRTANLAPEVAMVLLKSAFEWVYDYG